MLSLGALWTLSAPAADFVISNNAAICWFSDSCSGDSSVALGDASTGFQGEAYIHSYLALNYPQFNLSFYNLWRSGGNNQEMLTNRIEGQGLPLWGYQFNHNQHIGFVHAGDGGGFSSNQMYLIASNIFQGPALFHNGTAMTNEGGWCVGETIQWIGLGGFAELGASGSDGDFAGQGTRNIAMTNAGWILGARGIDSWYHTAPIFSNDFRGGLNQMGFITSGSKLGHLGPPGQLVWAVSTLSQLTTDTNISTCVLDFNSAIPSATNHCVISGISKSGNTLTFTRHDDRLPMAFDKADGDITYDCTSGLGASPATADYFQFTLRITNMTAGTYTVKIDGALCATLTSSQLAAGWNMFTNTTGPYWAQRKEVLGLIRDFEGADRRTLSGYGQGPIAANYGSFAGSRWVAGDRGDVLITSVSNHVASLQPYKDAIHAAAQPTNHVFTIAPVPVKAPFHVAQGMTLHLVFMDGIYTPISDDWTNFWTPIVFASADLEGLSRQCLTVSRTWELVNGHLAIAVTSEEPSQFYRVEFQPGFEEL